MCDRGVPAHLTRVFLGLHTQQQLCVLWNGATSDSFYANNEVKQSGVLSPILSCVYIDDLLQQLIDLDLGCHIGSVFCAVFAYADDIVLLSPFITALQTMLNVCQSYTVSADLLFIPGKSAAIRFGSSVTGWPVTCLRIGGDNIPWVTEVRHLGHIVTCDLKNTKDIDDKLHAFYGQANGFLVPYLDSALTRLRSCSVPTPHHSTAINCGPMPMHLTS